MSFSDAAITAKPGLAMSNLAQPKLNQQAGMSLDAPRIRSYRFDLAGPFSIERFFEAFAPTGEGRVLPMRQAFDNLLAWTGLTRMPLQSLSVVAVCGNTPVAAGLALAMLGQPEASAKKIALLEWAQPVPIVADLFDVPYQAGVSQALAEPASLEHLLASARMNRAGQGLYVFGQGRPPQDQADQTVRLRSLLAVFSRKFQRVVLSLPAPEEHPDLPALLRALGVTYALVDDPGEALLSNLGAFEARWPGGVLQRLR